MADKFERFESWLAENGSKYPKLELQDYGNEVRGCHATEKITNHDVIVDIPLKCLITVEMGKDTDIGRVITSSNIDLDAPKHIYLMLFILIDRKRPDSFFKPYYDILPPTLRNMPIFWDERELGYLRGSYLLYQIAERKDAIETDYQNIVEVCPEFVDICTLDEFKWARMCVCSRNFGITVNGLRTAALVPYADMLNHLRPRQSKWQFEDETQSFTISALDDIGVGAQVYDSYGQKCNHRFLLNYGFSVESNVESDGFCPNEVPFLVQLRADDPLLDAKSTILRRDGSGGGTSRRVRVAVGDGESAKVLLALLRLMELTKAEYDHAAAGPYGFRNLNAAMTPFTIENETRAMKALRTQCMALLDSYPTSYDEDVARLKGSRSTATGDAKDGDTSEIDPVAIPFTNERHAVLQVKGEKEVLGHYLVMSELALDLLTAGYEDVELESVIKERLKGKVHDSIYQYCRGPLLRLARDHHRASQRRELQVLEKTEVVPTLEKDA